MTSDRFDQAADIFRDLPHPLDADLLREDTTVIGGAIDIVGVAITICIFDELNAGLSRPSPSHMAIYWATSGSSAVSGEVLNLLAGPSAGHTSGFDCPPSWHASDGQSSKPSLVLDRMAKTNCFPTTSTRVMKGSGDLMYC